MRLEGKRTIVTGASDASAYITGTALPVDGGALIQ